MVRYLCAALGCTSLPNTWKVEKVWEHADKIQNVITVEARLGEAVVRAAVAHGGAAVQKAIEMEKDLRADVIEVMMCPLGCQNGGG